MIMSNALDGHKTKATSTILFSSKEMKTRAIIGGSYHSILLASLSPNHKKFSLTTTINQNLCPI